MRKLDSQFRSRKYFAWLCRGFGNFVPGIQEHCAVAHLQTLHGPGVKGCGCGVVMVELYQDRLQIVSPGGLPPGLRLEDLGRFSLPRNPLLADLFLRLGYVERAGSDIARIRAAIAEAGLPAPQFESGIFFTVVFPTSAQASVANGAKSGTKSGTKSGAKSGANRTPGEQQAAVLEFCRTPQSLTELMVYLRRSDRTKFRQSVVDPLIEAGWLTRTVPDRPRSRFQQYVTTPGGRRQIARSTAGPGNTGATKKSNRTT